MSFLTETDHQKDKAFWAIMDPHVVDPKGPVYQHAVEVSMDGAHEYTPWLNSLKSDWQWDCPKDTNSRCFFVIYFEDAQDAMLFKLTWSGQ